MSAEALAKAIEGLSLDDIFLAESTAWLAEEFDPKYDVRCEELAYQTKSVVVRSEILEIGNGESKKLVFRVWSELGVRIGCKSDLHSDNEDPEILALVEGSMCADYEIKTASLADDQEALDIFALKNVPYHVWPYWREFVTSHLQRMNMPRIVLPMQLRPSNSAPQNPL